MFTTLEIFIFYLLLLDSIIVNLMAWLGDRRTNKWYIKNFRTFSRYFPITKGWAVLYLVLVLWIGFAAL